MESLINQVVAGTEASTQLVGSEHSLADEIISVEQPHSDIHPNNTNNNTEEINSRISQQLQEICETVEKNLCEKSPCDLELLIGDVAKTTSAEIDPAFIDPAVKELCSNLLETIENSEKYVSQVENIRDYVKSRLLKRTIQVVDTRPHKLRHIDSNIRQNDHDTSLLQLQEQRDVDLNVPINDEEHLKTRTTSKSSPYPVNSNALKNDNVNYPNTPTAVIDDNREQPPETPASTSPLFIDQRIESPSPQQLKQIEHRLERDTLLRQKNALYIADNIQIKMEPEDDYPDVNILFLGENDTVCEEYRLDMLALRNSSQDRSSDSFSLEKILPLECLSKAPSNLYIPEPPPPTVLFAKQNTVESTQELQIESRPPKLYSCDNKVELKEPVPCYETAEIQPVTPVSNHTATTNTEQSLLLVPSLLCDEPTTGNNIAICIENAVDELVTLADALISPTSVNQDNVISRKETSGQSLTSSHEIDCNNTAQYELESPERNFDEKKHTNYQAKSECTIQNNDVSLLDVISTVSAKSTHPKTESESYVVKSTNQNKQNSLSVYLPSNIHSNNNCSNKKTPATDSVKLCKIEKFENKFLRCDQCSLCFKSHESLSFHATTHQALGGMPQRSNKRPNKCHKCQQSFKTEKLLLRHTLLRHTRDTSGYKCNICGQTFLKTFYLKSHLKSHRKCKLLKSEG